MFGVSAPPLSGKLGLVCCVGNSGTSRYSLHSNSGTPRTTSMDGWGSATHSAQRTPLTSPPLAEEDDPGDSFGSASDGRASGRTTGRFAAAAAASTAAGENENEGEGYVGEDVAKPRSLLLAIPTLLVLANVLDAGLGGGSLLASTVGVDGVESEGLTTLRDRTGGAMGSVALRRTMLSVMSESVDSSSSWVRAFLPSPPCPSLNANTRPLQHSAAAAAAGVRRLSSKWVPEFPPCVPHVRTEKRFSLRHIYQITSLAHHHCASPLHSPCFCLLPSGQVGGGLSTFYSLTHIRSSSRLRVVALGLDYPETHKPVGKQSRAH